MPPLGDLFSKYSSDFSGLIDRKIDGAKNEVKREVLKAAKTSSPFVAAAAAGFLSLLFVSFALAWLLDDYLPRSAAFVIVGAIYGIAAFVLLKIGRKNLNRSKPTN